VISQKDFIGSKTHKAYNTPTMNYNRSKDPKVDVSIMSREDAQSFYADEAKAQQLIRVGHNMLESEDIQGATSKFEEALLILKKYERYQKKN